MMCHLVHLGSQSPPQGTDCLQMSNCLPSLHPLLQPGCVALHQPPAGEGKQQAQWLEQEVLLSAGCCKAATDLAAH